jgi:hypothetical protein
MVNSRHDQTSRRLVMPELLESRNAPGALLPLPVLWDLFAADTSDAGPPLARGLSLSREESTYYRSDLISTASVPHLANASLANTWLAAETNDQPTQVKVDIARQATEFRTPAQLLAVNTAFASFSLNDVALVPINPQLPPPVIHPVEPPDGKTQDAHNLPDNSSEEAAVTPPRITQPVIMDPESEHNQPNSEPEHLTPPPVIQPVITDPSSEHNQPSPETETPPPLIQPVIMDPESEHNLQ